MTEHPAVVFLRQAHARAEKVARALPRGPWMWMGRWDAEGNYQSLEGPDEVPVLRSRAQAGNSSRMERHPAFDELLPDPEAVLRRVTAERQLLDLHQPVACEEFTCDCHRCCAVCRWTERDEDGREPVWGDVTRHVYPCRTVLLLAAGWGWTEDA